MLSGGDMPTLFIRLTSGTDGTGTLTHTYNFNVDKLDDAYSMFYDSTDTTVHLDIPCGRFELTRGEELNNTFYQSFAEVLPYSTSHPGLLLGGTLTLRVRISWDGIVQATTPTIPTTPNFYVDSTFPSSDAGTYVAVLFDANVPAGYDILAGEFPVSHSTQDYRTYTTAPGVGVSDGWIDMLLVQSCIASPSFAFFDSTPGTPADSVTLVNTSATGNGSTTALFAAYSTTNQIIDQQTSNLVVNHTYGFPSLQSFNFLFKGYPPPLNSGVILVPIGAGPGIPVLHFGRSYVTII